MESVESFEFLGVQINDTGLDTQHEALYRKAQSRLFSLTRLGLSNICSELLEMFHHFVVANALFVAVMCWEDSFLSFKAGEINTADNNKDNRLDKLVRKGQLCCWT